MFASIVYSCAALVSKVVGSRNLPLLQKIPLFRYLRSCNPNPGLGVLNLPLGRSFYKIEFKAGALTKQLSRYRQMSHEIKAMFCPITEQQILGANFCVMPKMDTNDNHATMLPFATKIHSTLKAYGQQLTCHYQDLPELVLGLQVLRNYTSENYIEKLESRLELIFNNSLLIGPTHGDFHARNIVLTNDERPMLLDPDCFREKSLISLDLVYYAVEAAIQAKNESNWWFEELYLAFNGKKDIAHWVRQLGGLCDLELQDALLVYLVDRIGQDHRYISSLSDRDVKWLQAKLELLFSQDNNC